MAKQSLKQLFAAKASRINQALGAPTSDVIFADERDRFEQRFEHGIIVSKSRDPRSVSSLVYVHDRLYGAAWSTGGAWLGSPLEDPYETKNGEEKDIEVQRFERGVIWCRVDGTGDVNWLGWRDWHAISRPRDNKNTPPSK